MIIGYGPENDKSWWFCSTLEEARGVIEKQGGGKIYKRIGKKTHLTIKEERTFPTGTKPKEWEFIE